MENQINLKVQVEQLAQKERITVLQVITMLQVAAVETGNDELLDELCDLKWEVIEEA